MMAIWAGFQTVDITPPVGAELAGYEERDHGSEGIANPLYARAMVVSNGKTKVCLVTSDLVGIDWQITKYVRGKVSRLTDIPEDHIMLTASHTHSGPNASRLSGWSAVKRTKRPTEAEKAYFLNLCESIAGAILAANRKLAPAKIGVETGHLKGLGCNRRDPNGPFDDRVTVLKVTGENGHVRGILVNYTCHPTVLSASNYLISGDYPSFMQESLTRVYPGCTPMFLQGAAGDVSTRHTRRGSTFEEARRMGELLAGKAIALASAARESDDDRLCAVVQEITLPVRKFPPDDVCQAMLREAQENLKRLRESGAPENLVRTAEVTLQGAERAILLKDLLGDQDIVTEMQALRIGPIVVVGVPAELFNEIGKEIKDSTDRATVVIAGYANDYVGYILTPDVYGEQGYEAGVTFTGVDAGEIIAKVGKEMVQDLVSDENSSW